MNTDDAVEGQFLQLLDGYKQLLQIHCHNATIPVMTVVAPATTGVIPPTEKPKKKKRKIIATTNSKHSQILLGTNKKKKKAARAAQVITTAPPPANMVWKRSGRRSPVLQHKEGIVLISAPLHTCRFGKAVHCVACAGAIDNRFDRFLRREWFYESQR